MAAGRVWMHREAMDHPVFQDDWLWRLFCWCIMRASYKDGKDKRGSFTTGRLIAAEVLGVTPSRVYEGWKRLEKLGCIRVESNNKYTTISVCNYETYQTWELDSPTTKQQRSNNKATTKQQQSNTDRNNSIQEEGNTVNQAELDALGDFTGYTQAFEMVWGSYPAKRRNKKALAMAEWKTAVEALTDRFGGRRQAEDWLHRRLLEFCKSPKAKSTFCPGISKWLADGCYDDPAEAWEAGESETQTTPPPIYKPTPPPARIPKADFTGLGRQEHANAMQ